MTTNFIVFILCKNISDRIETFSQILRLNHIEYSIICDDCSIKDDLSLLNQGFYNLTRSPYIKKPSAWDKSFYSIDKYAWLEKYQYFYFIEEDVYSKDYHTIVSFILYAQKLVNIDFLSQKIKPKSHHPTWKHWKEDYISHLKSPHQSFNPLCRLSSKLIKQVLEYKLIHNQFNFHEILFPSLCIEHNMTHLNYMEDEKLQKYVGYIRYNPIILENDISDNLIYHPVKYSKSDREKSIVPLDERR